LKVEFYEKADGSKPAEQFFDSLDVKMRSKMLLAVTALKEFGEHTRMPYSKHLTDGIFELRAQQGSDISRVLYFFVVGDKAILTNGFVKKTTKTPNNIIQTAKKYRNDYLDRRKPDD
jgi:phage-related protein